MLGSSSTFRLPFTLAGAGPLLEIRCQLLVGSPRWGHRANETPDLFCQRALPCLQKRVSRGVPARDHLATSLQEPRLSLGRLEVSGTKLSSDTFSAIAKMPGIGAQPGAMDAILKA